MRDSDDDPACRRPWFASTRQKHSQLELVQLYLGSKVQFVAENNSAFVTKRINFSCVNYHADFFVN